MATKKKLAGKTEGRPVWAEVSLPALVSNFRAIRAYVNPRGEKRQTPREVLAIVKGNGYGHGGAAVARALEKGGARWFGVTCAEEGVELRRAGVRGKILALTSFWPGEESRLVEHKLTPVVIRSEQLRALERAAARRRQGTGRAAFPFHLKIDSGMNRLGIATSEVEGFVQQLGECPHLRLDGVFTHFASSGVFDNSPAGRQTRRQEEEFHAAVARLHGLGVAPGMVHLANSGAITARPETWADMVRPGALLYGYHPGYDPAERRVELEAKLPLRTVMSLRARIISLREVAAGEGVGYDAVFTTARASRIAVISAGYGDGLHRSLGNRGRVLVRGQFAPIVGIVSMDVTMVDVTEVRGAALGDVVTIYGADGEHKHPANLVARSIGTVTSDLLCAVSARVPRVYLS
ncbi:MAG: alanine racemase [Acidobacteriia bacterium]|nr:alanine racemase [Terriglobia bacterium]